MTNREVQVVLPVVSVDFIKSFTKKIEELEADYFNSGNTLAALVGVDTIVASKLAGVSYDTNIDVDFAAAEYTVNTVVSISELP